MADKTRLEKLIEDICEMAGSNLPEEQKSRQMHAAAALAQVEATREQTAVLREQLAERRENAGLRVGMKILLQNNRAHTEAVDHMQRMLDGVVKASQTLSVRPKDEGAKAVVDNAIAFLKSGTRNFGPLFGRVLTVADYEALSAEERAVVDRDLNELIAYVRSRSGE